MGKKNKSNQPSLGRALIKDRFGANRGKRHVADNSMLHTTEIQDGYDWGRLNLQSVTEESSFQEFLSTAELAGTEFQAEKLNIKFINPRCNVGLLSKEEIAKTKEMHVKNRDYLKIPRRPKWDSTTTPEQLEQNERESFLEWRRTLARLQEEQEILLTPYEKNLEFWRQLWRVVERSDVIVQIVDARNPLLFRCEDLEQYVREVSPHKMNIILLNKADFLTEEQRQHWADYFTSLNVKIVFFSAIQEEEDNTNEDKDNCKADANILEEDSQSDNDREAESPTNIANVRSEIKRLEASVEETAKKLEVIYEKISNMINLEGEIDCSKMQNSSKLLTRLELIEVLRTVHKGPKVTENITTIGLVGYPNVGKSSTINALLLAKKVSVSATPGKTKHFQTLYLDKDILLCDCPGLVMPSFVFTKAEMINNGILPIDQMRDHVPPVNLVTSVVPRHILEDKYGIMLPPPLDGEDPNRAPTSEELLNAHAFNRGFMTANGQPDNPRSARYILKDYMNGKLLYCHAPPGVEQSKYHAWPENKKTTPLSDKKLPPRQLRAIKPNKVTSADVESSFFKSSSGAHTKGVQGKLHGIPNSSSNQSISGSMESVIIEKPWKIINKHANKKKKEKLRRVYAHLDQH